MMKKLTLLVGLGAGYVLGTKAGTERYDQIKCMAGGLMRQPKVQQLTDTVQHTVHDTATGLADKAKDAVNAQVEKVTATGAAPEPAPAPVPVTVAPDPVGRRT